MRTSKLRAMAVVAGFAGVSMLVAGTASAMVAGRVEAPVATAVQLPHEDPISQTAPVPAQANTQKPIEVGSAAIKCDDDGTCASRIKIDPKTVDAPPGGSTEPDANADDKNPGQSRQSAQEPDDRAADRSAPEPAHGDEPRASDAATADDSSDHTPTAPHQRGFQHGSDAWGFDAWESERWSTDLDEDWRDDFHDRWLDRIEQKWNPSDWFDEGWQTRLSKRNQ